MSAWRLSEATESCKTVFDRAWGGVPKREPDFMRFDGMLSHEDADRGAFPLTLPFVEGLDIRFRTPVTF